MVALLLPSSGQRSAQGYQSLLVHLLHAMSMRQCLRFKGECVHVGERRPPQCSVWLTCGLDRSE
jgi:hypothetical protein